MSGAGGLVRQETGAVAGPATERREPTGRVATLAGGRGGLALYALLGTAFGFVLTRAEVISWFRIQEMFRFQSFHMYGIIGSALVVAAGSLAMIRSRGMRTATGSQVVVPPKTMGRGVRYIAGGLLFGVGWALTGACPGPLLALVGSGVGVFVVAIAAALAGVWTYGHLRPHLPH